MKGTAYFVKNPSKMSNLVKPHRVEDEVSYRYDAEKCQDQRRAKN